jgi:Xaa-Pro aminopeptidase
MRRAYISGFNGSAGALRLLSIGFLCWHLCYGLVGCAIVTLTEAFLFTDGRYFLQAEQQLDSYVPSY